MLILDRASFVALLITLVWAPFPLGSNRPWSWSLLCLLISLCWLLWLGSVWARPAKVWNAGARIFPAIVCGCFALGWALVQTMPFVPSVWVHPVWKMAADALGQPLPAVISIDPWRTTTEFMKLLAYAMVFWMSYAHCASRERARIVLAGIIAIGAVYVGYAFVLSSLGTSQLNILYGGKTLVRDIAGPFVNHNSFATYAGLISVCAGARLVEEGWSRVSGRQGPRRLVFNVMQYLSGRGVPYFLASLMSVSAVMATSSRAGNFATAMAILAMAMIAARWVARHASLRSLSTAGLALLAASLVLFVIYGDTLAGRLNDISTVGMRDDTRLMLWNAAGRMVSDSPLLGLGLGTYQSAYPMYSDVVMPLFMDKAHNDFLELAAGWGLVASSMWLLALGVLAFICVRGVVSRHRDHVFAVVALGAILLVGIHSAFDFSLQMPAIALTFAVLLGLGVAQSFSARETATGCTLPETVTWATRIIMIIPLIALPWLAGPRLIDGLAEDSAAAATSRMTVNIPLSTKIYRQEALALTQASANNGESQILRAEGLMLSGASATETTPILQQGLSHTPSSARGWLLLAQALRTQDPNHAKSAFSLGFLLAPREYFLITPRILAGAPLWSILSPIEREQLLTDARTLLNDTMLEPSLDDVLAVPGGPALITASFAGHPDALRAFNRARARQRLGL